MITYIIIAMTVISSILAFGNQTLMSNCIFNPYVINSRKQYHRFVTSGFIHADLMHLFSICMPFTCLVQMWNWHLRRCFITLEALCI